MSDLDALNARVAAAQQQLQQAEDERQSMSARLLELINSVETALAEKQAEIHDYQATIEELHGETDEQRASLDALRRETEEQRTQLEAQSATASTLQTENQTLKDLLGRLLIAIEGGGDSSVGSAVEGLGSALATLKTEPAPTAGEPVADETLSPETLSPDALPAEAFEDVPAHDLEAEGMDEAPADETIAEETIAEETIAADPAAEIGPEQDLAQDLAMEGDADPGEEPSASIAPLEATASEPAEIDPLEIDLAGTEVTDVEATVGTDENDLELALDEDAEAPVEAGALDLADDGNGDIESAAAPTATPTTAPATTAENDGQTAAASASEDPVEAAEHDEFSLSHYTDDPLDGLPPGDPARVKAIIDRVSKLADEMAAQMTSEPLLAEKPELPLQQQTKAAS